MLTYRNNIYILYIKVIVRKCHSCTFDEKWYTNTMKNTTHDKKRLVENLLAWYDENARVLPWRSIPTPYRVWVSEIMLQQTRVEAVIPYFERFLTAFPDIEALANASDDELHKYWEGLGYYNRVKNMKKCAQKCMEEHGGKLPASYEDLLELPGIGEYTAAAIASIAFKIPKAAVDGNVLRVFSRLLVSEDDILKQSTKRKFQTIIDDYIPAERCDAFTQALMEIGALVCVPNAAPRCNICPLAMDCIGYQTFQANRLPNKTKKKSRRIEKKTIVLVVHERQVRLHLRPAEGLLSSLYEFVTVDDHIKRKDLMEMGQGHIIKVKKLPAAKHIFSHVEWHMIGYLIEVDTKDDAIWATAQEVEKVYAIPTAFKAYKEALLTIIKK